MSEHDSTLLPNGTLKSNEMLRNSAEDPRIFSAIEIRRRPFIALSPQHLFLFDIHLSHIMFPLTQDNFLRSTLKLKRNRSKPIRPNRIRSKQVTLNVAERRAATRVSMSELRRRKLKEFDYEAYRADFAETYISTNLIHWYFRLLDWGWGSTYNILTMTWKKTSETGLHNSAPEDPVCRLL